MQPPFEQDDYGWTQVNAPGRPDGSMQEGINTPPAGGGGTYQGMPLPPSGYGSMPAPPMPPMPPTPPMPSMPPQDMRGNGNIGANTENEPRRQTVHRVIDARENSEPPTGVRPRRRRKGSYIFVFVVIVSLILLAILLLGTSRSQYGYITRSTLNAAYSGDALVVRNEAMYTQEGITRIDYIAAEGSAVNRGDKVCTVYSSGFSNKELTTLEKYRKQIKEYHKTLLSSENVTDQKLNNLESVVLARAVETQALVQGARGNLINQEILLTEAMQDRMVYLKQKYPDDQKLTRLYEDENSQSQKISSWTKQYAANTRGLVSFYTDGYEPVLNISTYLDFEPGEVRSMIRGNVPDNPSATKNTVSIYRLVNPDSWSVLMLSDDRNWTPIVGRTYQLLIESFDNTVVNATVISFTLSGGELLIRLRVENPSASIENVLYTRACQVHLGESVDTLSVPESALYEQDGMIGVVIPSSDMSGVYFVPVSVISRESGIAHIVPSINGVLSEGMSVRLW